ncbi:spore germination protein B1 [Paraliobacillus ryukyuensis]|uniref:Spore germination protein n=1 Tax=Paraliobacillus ryukyuensis TaxID=200904 RepID=A0A366E9B5_9BACI|nr:spore germination protein [Paraliobacillus ryukyuensis]RBO98349.1 spore germination protein [Paraliobacillus ryukyuensis]
MDSVLAFILRQEVYFGTFMLIAIPVTLNISFKKLIELRKQANNSRSPLTKKKAKTQDVSSLLEPNIAFIKSRLGINTDIVFRNFNLAILNRKCTLVYIDGFVNKLAMRQFVVEPLMSKPCNHDQQMIKTSDVIAYLIDNVIPIIDMNTATSLDDSIYNILSGCPVLFVDGEAKCIIFKLKKEETRSIDEPVTEALVRGPRMGFLENLRDNTALLRSLSGDPNLTIVEQEVGERTKRKLAIVYISDIVNPDLLGEVKERIATIQLDNVPESGYIEQIIEDDYLSLFPQIQSTERPDRVMGGILEGRVAILLDGTPFALIVPVTFSMMLQTPEDYYERWISMSLIRLLRYAAIFITVFLPSFYIALVSFHQGLIPTDLALAIANSRVGVPFPSFIEALIMEAAIEMLREAGLRLPKPIGQTVGLVGAIIIGEAAVQAGLVSPIMIIVVAVTAISSFVTPQYGLGIGLRVLRILAMFCSATLGLYGITLFFLMLLIHGSKLKSFGVPYITPGTIYSKDDLKDFVFRFPLFTMNTRPKEFYPKNNKRKPK